MNEPKYKMTKKEFEKWFIKTSLYGIDGWFIKEAYRAYCKAWRDCEKYERWVNE